MDIIFDKFKTMVRLAMISARKANDCIFKSNISVFVATAHLNKAISYMTAASSLYYSRYDILERQEFEEILHQFDVFSSELLENVETDHSHQWTSIEFDRLDEIFKNSPFSIENE
jgi:uncharacterized protein involved in tolerance to divalent cations